MPEIATNSDHDGKSDPGELDLSDQNTDDDYALKVCPEFQKYGRCKAGVNCGFVHDGFGKDRDLSDSLITVDPGVFITHALQTPGGCKKLASGRVAVGGGW